jgi:cell wall-associated NlpC family hydrolase
MRVILVTSQPHTPAQTKAGSLNHRTHMKGTRHAIALAVSVVLLSATPVFATPAAVPGTSEIDVQATVQTEAFRAELAVKQQRINDYNTQLDALDRELEVAYEQYNGATEQLSDMKQRVAVAEGDLTNARTAFDAQAELLDKRVRDMYRQGELTEMQLLLDSKSVSDFMSRVKFLNAMGVRDAEIAASLRGQKALLEQQVVELKQGQAAAESLEFELRARKLEVMARVQERQAMIAQAKLELQGFLEAEAARRAAEQTALMGEVLSGANARGIVVQPGSPVETALSYHGVPYVWGGEKPSGFDCSGLMLYVFRQHGVNLPHYSGSQFRLGERVDFNDLQPGDAVFFGSPIHHVGMYIGGGYYLHAPRTGDYVKISKLADRSDFAGARRYAWMTRVEPPANAVKSVSSALSSVPR